MKWNPEQLEAIETLGQNTLVCASAGAGKTAVLVERLAKRVIRDRVSIDRIVAMTFTEAAASEMKERLSKRLHQELSVEGCDTDYIHSQITLLQNAQISTIHSFCMMLIKKHYDVIALDPAIPSNILSDGACLQAKNDAFTSILKEEIKKDKQAILALAHHFSSRPENFDELKKALFEMITIASTSENEEQWYKNAKQSYAPIHTQMDLPQDLLSFYFTAAKEDVDEQLSLVQQGIDCLMDIEHSKKEVALQTLNIKKQFLEDALLKIEDNDIQSFVTSFQRALAKPLIQLMKTPTYQAIKASLKSHTDECLKNYADFEMMKSWHNQTSPIATSLIDLAQKVHHQYKINKQQLQGLEFNDMENYAWAILQANQGAISSYYKDFYKEILVDEFQDTNEVQNEIIKAISNGSNAFRVGDVKQSIYRFRHAKPSLMRELMKDPNTKVIFLSFNYRSNQGIVEFNNNFFNLSMNIEGCKDQYLKEDCVQAGTEKQKEVYHPVEFYGMNLEAINETRETPYTSKQAKASFIAHKIIEMRRKTPFKKWRDYVILTRNHADKLILKSVFDELNIPYSIDSKEGFYQSECAQIVISFLQLTLNLYQDIPLVAVLTSPLYQMSDDQLASLKVDYGSVLQGCFKTNHPLLSDLKKAQSILEEEGLLALFTFISEINHFYHDHLSIQQKTNFDLLFSKVIDFEKKSQSLLSFLQEIELNLEEKSDEAIALGSQDDVVRAITIHHSKGLQFNVVFYWSTSRLDNMDKRSKLLVDSKLGIAMHNLISEDRYQFPSLHRFVFDYKNNLEDLEEAIRVLYVALTRPQHHLIIVDAIKELPVKEKLSLSLLKQRKGSTHLLLKALLDESVFKVHEINQFNHVLPVPLALIKSKKFNKVYSFERPSVLNVLSPSQLSHSHQEALTINDHQGALYGTRLHELVEKLPNRQWTIDDFKSLDCTDSEQRKLLTLSNNSLYQRCLSMQIVKEAPFHLLSDDQSISGIMDFVAIGDKEIILIDFKSDANIDEEKLKERYKKQLDLYQLALKNTYPNHRIHSYLYSFFLGKEVQL